MPDESVVPEIGKRIMNAINDRDYPAFDALMAEDFVAHQYGLSQDLHGREAYKTALRWVISVLAMTAHIDVAFATGDRLVARITLRGRHVGNIFGLAPTDKALEWTTIETYRLEDGKLKERWAIDDMWTLFSQLGVKLPG